MFLRFVNLLPCQFHKRNVRVGVVCAALVFQYDIYERERYLNVKVPSLRLYITLGK